MPAAMPPGSLPGFSSTALLVLLAAAAGAGLIAPHFFAAYWLAVALLIAACRPTAFYAVPVL